MGRRVLPILSPCLVLALGCLQPGPDTTLVPDNPFGHVIAAPPGAKAAYRPATLEAAARVDTVGRKLVKANPQLGMQPQFGTIGVSQPEIFHRGTLAVEITEGLVKQCSTEGQLAAVLSVELGKMVAEREALAGPETPAPQRTPPPDERIGNDNGGSFGSADQLHRAELAAYDKQRQRKSATPPDPQALARGYLAKAGYSPDDLSAVAPLLQAAAENTTYAKQLLAPPPGTQPAKP